MTLTAARRTRRSEPTIGIMHKPKKGSPAYALHIIEPLRPVVDRPILSFVQSETFGEKDLTIQGNGVCRLNPELARRVVQGVGNESCLCKNASTGLDARRICATSDASQASFTRD